MNARFEYATGRDPALNYCLWSYAPAAAQADKHRSINLLWHAFALAGATPRAYRFVEAIREAIGDFRTVFGVKQIGDRIAFEFYFYDYARRAREVSLGRVLHAVREVAPCALAVNESLPYFMFSLDLDAGAMAGPLEGAHIYVGNPGSAVSSGIAYGVSAGGLKLENFYFFFDARAQRDEAAEKIRNSAFFDAGALAVETVLVPELANCRTICVANKQTHDCVYFSGVDVDQLLHFLRRLRYQETIVDFVAHNRARLDHLLYDVGFDYRVEDGRLVVLKSGYYGVF